VKIYGRLSYRPKEILYFFELTTVNDPDLLPGWVGMDGV
jgi:hypothetical protein